jgi:hypothetical protein
MANIRLRYQTIEFGDIDIHLCTLRDKQQFDDPNGVVGYITKAKPCGEEGD